MCRKVTCRRCQKPSWAGCGAHVEQVLGGIPKSDRCQCATSGTASSSPRGGFLSSLRRKKA